MPAAGLRGCSSRVACLGREGFGTFEKRGGGLGPTAPLQLLWVGGEVVGGFLLEFKRCFFNRFIALESGLFCFFVTCSSRILECSLGGVFMVLS